MTDVNYKKGSYFFNIMCGVGPLRERRQLTFVFFNRLSDKKGGGGGGQISKKICLQTYLGTKV